MSCLFENDNKISTCKIDEGKKEVCSKMAKEQGYTDCIYIKTNNKEDDLIWLNKLIEESKEREKLLDDYIEKFKDNANLKCLWNLNRAYISILENIKEKKSKRYEK
ncbi:hypothetical protein [Romboutsia sp. MSSM.1001216sp_RTP31141st1_G3_RTP31141_220114]|uniref:hypothetical protein n=1 Tax=unclassified Romboutsia TaxID=2626894 RepID=UPI0031B63CFE